MRIKKRRPDFSGYLESDREFFENNRELINSIFEPDIQNKRKTMEIIDFHCQQINIISAKLVESEARKILLDHPNLKEFIMAMGTAFFTDRQDKVIAILDKSYLKAFDEMICNLDNICQVKGTPMRFTATSKTITNW
jgi:hypothetical protein